MNTWLRIHGQSLVVNSFATALFVEKSLAVCYRITLFSDQKQF